MSHKKLFFVDDDLSVLSAYQRMLRTSGYHCDFEQDPNAVIARIDLNMVDIIFVDQKMPGLSGIALIASLKEKFPLLKCVMVSGDLASINKAVKDGLCLDAMLPKPLSKSDLIKCITSLSESS